MMGPDGRTYHHQHSHYIIPCICCLCDHHDLYNYYDRDLDQGPNTRSTEYFIDVISYSQAWEVSLDQHEEVTIKCELS